MERSMQQFRFFVVTKGYNTGVYVSFEEANRQIVNHPEPEYTGFNSYVLAIHAYEARMETLREDREATLEIMAETGTAESPQRPPRTLPTSDGRVASVFHCVLLSFPGAPLIPADECASHHFALSNSMELWLLMYCYDAKIPSPCFFREEKFHRYLGAIYAFNVIIPGNPFGPDVRAKGRYTFLEDDAREDAAFSMLRVLLADTETQIRDFNYLLAKSLQRENAHLQDEIARLESKIHMLESICDNSLECITP
ncbi:hypothetical protein AHAS_Ahas10G0190000 [Arachis hypogaea]